MAFQPAALCITDAPPITKAAMKDSVMDDARSVKWSMDEKPGPCFEVGQVWKLKNFKAALGGDADRKWLRLKRAGLECWDEGGCAFIFIDQLVQMILTKKVVPPYRKVAATKPKKRR